MLKVKSIILLLCIITYNNAQLVCELNPDLEEEILSYQDTVNTIIGAVTNGEFKGAAYKLLSDFTDMFGPRLAGSEALEKSIDYILNKSIESGLDNVHGEEVEVPHWIRGEESATLIEPWHKKLQMLGLGSSVGTPSEGIEAEAIVVESFEELDQLSEEIVQGKIVIYSPEWLGYGVTGQYRYYGASRASQRGAVAALIRSITPFSLGTPHTGMQEYFSNVTEIPAACITVEDAQMLHRMYKNGQPIRINIKMDAKNLSPTISRNGVIELQGMTNPENVVIVSGHIDSWDVGQGAMDDAGGTLVSWQSLIILKSLNLIPKRTIRSILWTAEEEGLIGALAYYEAHRNEIDNLNLVMESDFGTFNPQGLYFSGNDEAACIMQRILELLAPINTTTLVQSPRVGSDISVWANDGVPMAELLHDSENYFWYHHSEADTINVYDSETLDKVTALMTSVAFIVADLQNELPRYKSV